MIRFVGRMVQAGWYLALTLLFLVGPPWALIYFFGWPLPRTVPDAETLDAWLTDPLELNRSLKLLAIAFWLVWAAFVVFIVMEIYGRIREIRMPQIRLATPLQSVAAGLVGATATALGTSAGHAAPPPAPVDAAVATAPDRHGGAATGPVEEAADQAHHTAADLVDPGEYVIASGDWLSAIAQRFLGSRDDYARLQALNPQLEKRDHRFPDHIEPGWRLRLPSDAYDRDSRPHATGQVLSLAATTPTDPPEATEPAPAPDPVSEPTPGSPAATSTPAGESLSSAQDDEPQGPSENLPTDFDPDLAARGSTGGAMAGAGLLASLLFATLIAERRRQQPFYAAGQEPPRPNGRAERELRAAQQPADVERLDAALRHLGQALTDRDTRPDVVGVRLVGGDVHLLLAGPDDDPPPPWLDEDIQWALPSYVEPPAADPPTALLPLLATVGSRGGRHLLIDLERLGVLSIDGDRQRSRDLLRHLACELACNTWSERVTVILAGFGDEADAIATIDPAGVEAAGALGTITELRGLIADRAAGGHPEHASEPDVLFVLLVLDPDETTRAALADLHRDLVGAGRMGIATVATVGAGPAIGEATLTVDEEGMLRVNVPGLRLSTNAAAVPVDMLDPLAHVFRVARLTPATVLTPAAQADLPPWNEDIDPAPGALAVFDPHAWTPQTTGEPATPAVQPATATVREQHRPAATEPADETLDDDLAGWRENDPTRPRVAILGPIQAHLPGPMLDNRRRFYTELLLFLLTRNQRSASREQIEDALWSGAPVKDGAVRAAMSNLRDWLGRRSDSVDWIPESGADGAYRLAEGALLDWHLLLRLRERADTRGGDGIDDYRAALELVRGEPMHGVVDRGRYRRPYTWLGDSDIANGRIVAAVADIAHRVAAHDLNQGDAAGARWAVAKGWLADPHRSTDDLWHDRLRAEYLDGRTAALHRLVTELLHARDAEVPEDLQPRTYELVRELVPSAT